MKKFSEILEGKVIKEGIETEKRIVVAGVLEGDSMSENGRFYPASVVESVSQSVVGKPSLIGHDTDSPKDIVARIVQSSMSGKKLIASFKFGTDELSEMMFSKVREGLVDSYSIRAYGTTKRGKVDNQEVDIVQSLEIASVDLVVEGGVKAAKVLHVFESTPKVELKEESDMTEEQKKQLEEAIAKAKQLEEEKAKVEAELAESKKKQEESEKKEAESKLKLYVEKKLSTIADTDVRKLVAEAITGRTEEEVNKQFETQLAILKRVGEGKSFIIKPVDGEKEVEENATINDVLMGESVKKDDKLALLRAWMGVKSN